MHNRNKLYEIVCYSDCLIHKVYFHGENNIILLKSIKTVFTDYFLKSNNTEGIA